MIIKKSFEMSRLGIMDSQTQTEEERLFNEQISRWRKFWVEEAE